jgi:hypothetical protein
MVGSDLLVDITPSKIEVEPGATPAEAVVVIQNLGDLVEQYTVEVIGLDSDWYTAPVASVGLFPQDRDQVRVTFHPPKRPGLRAGAYHFKVRVRSRSGGTERTAEGVLDVRGYAVFRLDMAPRRQKARGKGQFKIQLSNSGTADTRVALTAADNEEKCRFRFGSEDAVLIPAAGKIDVPLTVIPKRRPWFGQDATHAFTVNARPDGSRGEPQTVQGSYVYQPFMKSLAWLRKLVIALVVILLLLVGINYLLATDLSRLFPQRLQVARGQVCGTVSRVPGLGGLLCRSGPAAAPVVNAACAFDQGFEEFATSEKQLVGACTTDVAYDGFGNGLQYTKNGVLFWNKASNTVYFFRDKTLYVRIAEKTRVLDGPGA